MKETLNEIEPSLNEVYALPLYNQAAKIKKKKVDLFLAEIKEDMIIL